ncbi:hypothetical protein D3C75_1209460 [compost metagenome]
MGLPLLEVIAVLHGQRDQVRTHVRAFALDDSPASQIRAQGFCPAPDGTERADQVLLAERGVVQPYLAHRVVLPEVQVVSAGGEACGCFRGRRRWSAPQVLQHV